MIKNNTLDIKIRERFSKTNFQELFSKIVMTLIFFYHGPKLGFNLCLWNNKPCLS